VSAPTLPDQRLAAALAVELVEAMNCQDPASIEALLSPDARLELGMPASPGRAADRIVALTHALCGRSSRPRRVQLTSLAGESEVALLDFEVTGADGWSSHGVMGVRAWDDRIQELSIVLDVASGY